MKIKYLLLYIAIFVTCFFSSAQVSRSVESIGITDVIVIELAGNGDIWAGSATQGVAFYKADIAQWSYFDSLNSPLKSNAITSIT